MKPIKIDELLGALDFLSIKDLEVESLKELLKLRKTLKSTKETIKELQVEIMKKFEVAETNGSYEFSKHKDRKQIEADLKTVNEGDYLILPLNFIPFEKIKSNNSPNQFQSSDSLALLEVLTDNLAKP